MGLPYPSAPPPPVRQPELPELWGLFAPHSFRVGYLLAGRYTSNRYASSWSAVEHFAEMILLRHPEAEVVVEAIPAGEVVCAYEEPRFPNLWGAPAEREAGLLDTPLAGPRDFVVAAA